MCAYLRATVTPSRSLNTPLPFVALAGIASFALFCRTISSFFKSRPRSYFVNLNSTEKSRPRSYSVNLNSTEKFLYNANQPNVYADGEEMVDRISQLSDDIICLIITQLSARAVVRTSVLSRRWRNLYRFIPTVRFHCLNMYGVDHLYRVNLYPLRRKFVEGVDTFLQHLSSHKITCLILSCCFSGSILHKFRKWMQSLGGFGVEQLILFQLISETSSVKILRLNDCSLQPTFKSQFNFLKFLVLTNVALDVAAVDCILSNCESLESLKFFQCIFPPKLRIHGPDLKLKILIASFCKNVKEIDLYAANLITFEYCHWKMPTLSLSYVPLLQKLCIEFFGNYAVPCVFGKLAKDVPHLRSLIFAACSNFYLGCKLSGLSNKLSDLRQLVLTLDQENACDLLRITPILDVCPLLEKFHLSMIESTFNGPQVEKSATFHPSLKQVRLSGFCGTRNEISFALYILKSAVVLGEMSISPRFCCYVGDGKWFEENASSSWDEEKRRMIQERLQGQASSKSAKIITL